jgi:hypothetical protein
MACAVSSQIQIQTLLDGQVLWGILQSIQPADDGLLYVKVSSMDALVSRDLELKLQGLIGKNMVIGRIFGKWCAGEMRS